MIENTKKIYKEQYEKFFEMYKDMLNDYEKETTSARYHRILSTMPFEFLNATQLCESLSLYEKLETKPRMHFSTLDEACVFYRKLITFGKSSDNLLEDAAYIAEIGRIAESINGCVLSTPYLDESYCVVPNTEVISLAQRCLKEVPKFPQMLSKKFRWNYIESAIRSLDNESLKYMVDSKIIKPADIDHIALVDEDSEYRQKVAYLCEILSHPQPIVASYELKLKGVTFPNEDGSSRQENIELLKKYAEENEGAVIPLVAQLYTYTPEIGAPEPAIKILWNDKEIGNIAKDVVEEIIEKYENPQFTVELKTVAGGDEKINFGCIVNFHIIAPGYSNMKALKPDNREIEK